MSFFRRSEFINISDLNRALPSRPGATPADDSRTDMLTSNQSSLPVKAGRAKGGVSCPKCGHSHSPGSICAYMKGLSDWLDKANTTPNRFHLMGSGREERDENGRVTGIKSGGGSKGDNTKADAPKNPELTNLSGPPDSTEVEVDSPNRPDWVLHKPSSGVPSGPSEQENSDQFWADAQGEWNRGKHSSSGQTSSPATVASGMGGKTTVDSLPYDKTQASPFTSNVEGGPADLMSPQLMQQAQNDEFQSQIEPTGYPTAGQVSSQQMPGMEPTAHPAGEEQIPLAIPGMEPTAHPTTGAIETPQMPGLMPNQIPMQQPGADTNGLAPQDLQNPQQNDPAADRPPPTRAGQYKLNVANMLPGNARAIGAGLGTAGGTIGSTASALAQPAHSLLHQTVGKRPNQGGTNDSKTIRDQQAAEQQAATMAAYGQRTRQPMPKPTIIPGIK